MNGLRYRTMINKFLWPELEDMDVDDVYFQQDCATCYTSGKIIGLLREKFPGRVIFRNGDYKWPPRSCDLTHLDFFLWGCVKDKFYADDFSVNSGIQCEDPCRYRRNRAPNVQKCNRKFDQKAMVLQR